MKINLRKSAMLMLAAIGGSLSMSAALQEVKAWDFRAISDAMTDEAYYVTYDDATVSINNVACNIGDGDFEGLAFQAPGGWFVRNPSKGNGLYQGNGGGRILGILDVQAGDQVVIAASGTDCFSGEVNSELTSTDADTNTVTYTVTEDGNFGVYITRYYYIYNVTVQRDIEEPAEPTYSEVLNWDFKAFSDVMTDEAYYVTYDDATVSINNVACNIGDGIFEGLAFQAPGGWFVRYPAKGNGLYQGNGGGRILGVLDLKADDKVVIAASATDCFYSESNATLDSTDEESNTVIYTVTEDGNFGVYVTRYYYIYSITVLRAEEGGEVAGDGEAVVLNVQNMMNVDIAYPCTTSILANEDGSYTISNFLNSGSPLSFKFGNKFVDYCNYDIEIVSPVDDNGYFLGADGVTPMVCNLYGYNGDASATPIYAPSLVLDYWSMIRKYDVEDNAAYDYFATLCIKGYLDEELTTAVTGNFFVNFDFNGEVEDDPSSGDEPGDEPSEEPVEGQVVTVYIDSQDWTYTEVADPYETTIIANEDGSYTLNDYFNSGEPFSFKFEEPAAGGWVNGIEITSPVDDSATYPYLLGADGESYVFGYMYGYNGLEVWTSIDFIYVAPTYSWVYRYDEGEDEDGADYYARICTDGYDDDGNYYPWMFVDFKFNKGEEGPTVGVAAVEVSADNDAWYNLQGVKVAAPTSKGIYIHNGKKVVVK